MTDNKIRSEVPIGRYLAQVRDHAGLTQAVLAHKVTYSAASISRIESGDKAVTEEELAAILGAIGTPKARELEEYLDQNWDKVERPPLDHPDRPALWQANLTLRELQKVRDNPDVKGVFVRQIDFYERELKRLALLLQKCDHQVAFIGTIGVGKSTAICKLTELIKPGESKLDREIVLETGAGGITMCEVHIVQGPEYGLRIDPRGDGAIRDDVREFAEYLMRVAHPGSKPVNDGDEDGDILGISKEVVRAIRNMADLVPSRKTVDGRRLTVDPAKDLIAKHPRVDELTIQIMMRMNLLRRNRREAWYPTDSAKSPIDWLQELFAQINNGRNAEFTMPSRIEIIVPDPLLESRELPLRIIDTKGVDQTAAREDLECHFDVSGTLVVICTRFNDAPDMTTQTLLVRAREVGVRDIEAKTMVLVLPRPEEALAVKHDDGANAEDEEVGYELKREQIDLRLKGMKLDGLPVLFFNAKEEKVAHTRDRIVEKIVQYRRHHAEQITQVTKAVDHLIQNQEDEQMRLVFEQVGKQLSTWIDRNREIDWEEMPVQESLLEAIESTRYAGKIRGAVNRQGSYADLDYYHHLGHGARRIAVRVLDPKIRKFKVIVENQLHNPEYSDATAFLERLLHSLDSSVNTAYLNVQLTGREAFKDELRNDSDFWRQCRDRWGRGTGYRADIRDMTGKQFESFYDNARQLVRNSINEEWANVILLLETLLGEKGPQVVTAAR